MKSLVLAEKPSVAKEIARVLGCRQNVPGALIGKDYIVTWALGHLVTLAMPEEYFKVWENWSIETLPMIPNKFKTVVIKETSKQYSIVKSYLRANDIKDLIIATDAGREGELVARWIIEQSGFKKPMKRLWISSMTDSAIRQGFQNLKPASLYDNLYYSALARAKADWLVGLNVTRALTCKYNAQLSAGRVQTPTLAIIVDREKEINRFKPVPYYQLFLNYVLRKQKIHFIMYLQNENRIYQEEQAKKYYDRLNRKKVVVSKVEQIEKKTINPLLYDLTELQRDANKLYGFSAKMTLDLLQTLYERYKLVTYPRTDSRYLTTDMYQEMKVRIKNLNFGDYAILTKKILGGRINNSKRIFDNQKVTDHHAIIPTELKPNILSLSNNERRIYELIVERFLAAFLEEYEYYETLVEVKVDNMIFKAKGNVIKKLGWKEVYQKSNFLEENEEYQQMPEFKIGQILDNITLELRKSLTTPPARYTEASLLSAMEHPAKFVGSNQAKTILEDTGGLGTPATRAEIIEKLFNTNYLELKGKIIYPTSKGFQLISLVPEKLRSPLLTADYETRLKQISLGKELESSFLNDIILETKSLVKNVASSSTSYHHDNMTGKKCPECGKNLLEINNKMGKSLVCMDRNCKYRLVISKHTELRCPTCKKKLDLIGTGEQRYYLCVCGYKERAVLLEKKLSEKRKEMSKKDISNYLKKQEKEIPANNPFSDFFNK